MKTDNTLIAQILAAAQAAGLTQKELAARSGIQEETISRMKQRGSGNFKLVVKLAEAAGVPLCLTNTTASKPAVQAARSFRDKYAVPLAWSNKNTSDDVLMRRALVKPGFRLLLDAAIEFGVERLATTWAELKQEGASDTMAATQMTERILGHISHGYRQATR